MSAPLARTTLGSVRGRPKEGALLFASIPYAAPPTGPRRFRPPQPHGGWRGVRDALRFGPAAPQPKGVGLTAIPGLRWDEEACLTLNVCTPALDEARRPVFVWLHGGAFRTGQGATPWYNGASFATRGDVVVVSLNYRLGALGFAHLAALDADYASSGLSGILDQLAALEWVRDNIAAFGGDPARVTLAGESAGAMSVGVLLGCPAAQGLFRAAVPQSGAAAHVLSSAEAERTTEALLEALGVHELRGLLDAPAERILEAQLAVEELTRRSGSKLASRGLSGMPFQPVVEGRVLPEPPLEAVRHGLARGVRLLTGTNRHEGTLFVDGKTDEARLGRIAARHFPDPDAALATYRAEWPGASAHELLVAILTDSAFRIPAVRLAEAHAAAGGQVWKYLFSFESRAFDGRLGATHALEIPFVFDNLDRPGVEVFLGPGEKPRELAARMHAAWTAFVYGDPPAAEGLGPWPSYTPERRAVMELGLRCSLLDDPHPATRQLWNSGT